jgi:RNA polymerase sigma factor (sigma-70 family)
MDDTTLVKEFLRGDTEAFSELVRKYSRSLTMMILKMVKDPEEAKDISQQAFLKAYEALPKFAMASSFKTWLYSIAINAVRDSFRKRKNVVDPDLLQYLPDPGDSPLDRLDREVNLEKLRKAIKELPEKQRLTLQLRIYEEMDYKEIAKVMGGSEGAARVNFFQAAKTLREKLGGKNEKHMFGN